ncbi:hypothetical protein ACFVYD_23630 [Streptomyces sp. NPDC058301]|uniref:hypothetical protein n=1 Tax=Streptomyces sp. NPDC058301 TaxID=3346436 RepID=UPI0036EBD44D
MTTSPTRLMLFTLALLAALLLSLLSAVTAALLAYWDGASLPGSLQRGGAVFGGTLPLLVALLAFGARYLV